MNWITQGENSHHFIEAARKQAQDNLLPQSVHRASRIIPVSSSHVSRVETSSNSPHFVNTKLETPSDLLSLESRSSIESSSNLRSFSIPSMPILNIPSNLGFDCSGNDESEDLDPLMRLGPPNPEIKGWESEDLDPLRLGPPDPEIKGWESEDLSRIVPGRYTGLHDAMWTTDSDKGDKDRYVYRGLPD